MRLLNKFLICFAFFLLAFLFAPTRVHAYVPDVEGYVKTTTGAPVAGVWVRWKENPVPATGNGNGIRYAQTDSDGRFFFVSDTTTFLLDGNDPAFNEEYNRMIDTDLDGVVDTRMRSVPYDEPDHFGCWQNPHELSVVTPQGWSGTFDNAEVNAVSFANVYELVNIGTIYYQPTAVGPSTPAPTFSTPVPTPAAVCTDLNCTEKRLGTKGIGFTTVSTDLELGSEYWVRIIVKGRTNDIAGKRVTINEVINNTYFEILPLVVGTTFDLSIKDVSGNMVPLNGICTPLASCVISSNATQATLSLPEPKIGEEIHLLFKVRTIAATDTVASGKVDVDSSSSNLSYFDGNNFPINNTQVSIKPNLDPYFSTYKGGNVYGFRGVDSMLPPGAYLIHDPSGIAMSGSNISVNKGEVSQTNWEITQYPITNNQMSYANLYDTYRNNTSTISSSDLKTVGSGRYHIVGDLTIDSTTLPNPIDSSLIIFVEGNVYIRSETEVLSDGRNSLAIIASKNIGIDPALRDDRQVHGVYIADGAIDTSCSSTFDGVGRCPSTTDENNSTLTLEGVFIGNGKNGVRQGFNLDRNKVNSLEPSEKFIYRPDFILSLTESLGFINYTWNEIAN